MGKARQAGLILLSVLLVVVLDACAATQTMPLERGGPGFWLGLWHGFIARSPSSSASFATI